MEGDRRLPPQGLASKGHETGGVIKLPQFNLEIFIRQHERVARAATVGINEKFGISKPHGARFPAFTHPKLFFDDSECSKVEVFRGRRRQIIGALHRVYSMQ